MISLGTLLNVILMFHVSDRSSALLKEQVPKIIKYMKIEQEITEEMDFVSLYMSTKNPAYLNQFRQLSIDIQTVSNSLWEGAPTQERHSIEKYFYTEEEWQQVVSNRVIPFIQNGNDQAAEEQWQQAQNMANELKNQLITFFRDKSNAMDQASNETSHYIQQTIDICLAVILITIAAAFWLSLWFTRRLIQPIIFLSKKVDALTAGQMDVRAEVGSLDEIGSLASNFNRMAISLSQMLHQLESSNRALIKESEQSREQTRLKSEFLAMVSHEIRTPLHAILGFSEVLQEEYAGPLTDQQLKYISHIKQSGIHLLSLINDLLDLSKIEAGKMELELTETKAPDFLKDALVLIQEQASKKNIDLLFRPEGNEWVWIDERKVKQIALNLLSNAVKYTPQGGTVGLDIWVGTGILKFIVWDTGKGIPEKHLEDIFTEFFQGKDPGPEHIEGTGLGLALVKRLVLLHGGDIHAESQVGAGSRFTVILPTVRSVPLLAIKGESIQ